MLKNKKIRVVLVLLEVVVLLCAVFGIYVSHYYHANNTAVEATFSDSTVTVIQKNDDCMVFTPKEPERGLVFYPGGKVEYTAYAPLMKALAAEGFFCVLVKMPFNLAVFDVNAADDVIEEYTHIDEWYIGGHSLGGSMAASYAANNNNKLEGLILLGSYSTEDLNDKGLTVFEIHASEDEIWMPDDVEKYKEYKGNLPSDTFNISIEGGCHAYFGSYGKQEGDGTPTISPEEQIRQTVEFITENINK